MTNFADVTFAREIPNQNLFSLLLAALRDTGINFRYSGEDYDGCGILYWLGTNEYQKPYEIPEVEVTYQGIHNSGPITQFVQHSIGMLYLHREIHEKPNYLQVSFESHRIKVSPSTFTLSYYIDGVDQFPLNWQLKASDGDGDNWDVLYDNKNIRCLDSDTKTRTFKLVPTSSKYDRFRVEQTGCTNRPDQYYLAVSGLELYGKVYKQY
jgi:hypothetical protein